MNEAETRAEYVDPALKAAGWGVVEGSRLRREYPIAPGRLEGHGKRGKALTADYVLEYRNTKLGVVEAKALDEELTEGVAQAKNYAGKLAVRHAYATNGRGIYAIDMQTGAEGEIAAYPTPDQLWAMTFPSTRSGTGDAADRASELAELWRDRFAAIPFEDKGGSHPSRYYQDIAIERAMQAIAGAGPHPAHAGHRHRQNLHRLPDRLETLPARWNLGGSPPAARASYSWRPATSSPTSLQRVLGVPGRRHGAHQTRGHPKGGFKNGSLSLPFSRTFMASAGSATEKGASLSLSKGRLGTAGSC